MSEMGESEPSGSRFADLAAWFRREGRDLPWRAPGLRTGGPVRPRRGDRHDFAWGVLVSEVMLQQTPVDRVLPVWSTWLARWPTASSLSASPSGDAIRAWGRLGYPRRALRLHAAAVAMTTSYDGRVPRDREQLLALPGIGDYTAGAVRAFAYGEPDLALDTNVRRVLARAVDGRDRPATSVTVAERAAAGRLMPPEPAKPGGLADGTAGQPAKPGGLADGTAGQSGAHWMAALMELGARVCTARQPRCDECPLAPGCRWLAAGRPSSPAPRRQPAYEGSDRQARGALLAVIRAAPGPVSQARVDAAWPEPVQRARALDGLVSDGLVAPASRGRWQLG